MRWADETVNERAAILSAEIGTNAQELPFGVSTIEAIEAGADKITRDSDSFINYPAADDSLVENFRKYQVGEILQLGNKFQAAMTELDPLPGIAPDSTEFLNSVIVLGMMRFYQLPRPEDLKMKDSMTFLPASYPRSTNISRRPIQEWI